MRTRHALILTALLGLTGTHAMATDRRFETFDDTPAARWSFLADTVMGGVSTGQVQFDREGTTSFVRLSGEVSTANNGGFIQVRRKLSQPLPEDVRGLRLVVRGNGGPYFVHLRTRGTRLPWQYYQARFPTGDGWTEIRLPLSAFHPSGRLLRATPSAQSITSVGIVAYGRDHSALVEVSQIDWF